MASYLDKDGLLYLWGKIKNITNAKVDKVEGKGLSTNDYDAAAAAEVAKVVNKVDKVEGKGLSTNDYDATAVAEVAKVKDKVDKVEGKGLSTNDYTTEEKNKLAAFGEASTYALKSDLSSLYKFKGSVNAYSDLPTEGLTIGDVYDVKTDGRNYAWTGTEWDALGGTLAVEKITNTEIDDIVK